MLSAPEIKIKKIQAEAWASSPGVCWLFNLYQALVPDMFLFIFVCFFINLNLYIILN